MSKPRRPSRLEDGVSGSSSSPAGGHKKSTSSSPASGPSASARSTAASTADFLKTDDVLQAVLLADSFTVKFRPVTLERPKVLLPLLNLPMIDYALEFLVSGGVQELFIFCCSHAHAIREHISASRLLKRTTCAVRVVVSKECYSAGDALRHLDTLDLIKSDFVLMSGDVVTNLKLERLLREHRQRVRADKNTLMTLVMKRAAAQHRVRSLDDDTVVAVVPSSSRLLLYQNSFSAASTPPLHTDAFSAHPCIQYRYDLLDTHIALCTPQVLLLFTDNFDYQSIRKDFIPGILGQEDILGHTLYLSVLHEEYAVCVGDLHTYAAVSGEMMHRWAFPYVPDLNLIGDTSYRYERGNRYREDGVQVARDAVVGEDTVIGRGTVIGEGSVVRRSVIGRNCVIGKRVTIVGSFVWSRVSIEDGASIDRAILCDGVAVGRDAVIPRGAILSYEVVIGADVRLPDYAKVSRAQKDDAVFEDDSPHPNDAAAPAAEHWDEAVVGRGGKGALYTEEAREEEDEEEEIRVEGLNSIAVNEEQRREAWKLKRELEQDAESENEWDVPEEDVDDADDEKGPQRPQANSVHVGASPPTVRSPTARIAGADDDELPRFYTEAIATLQRGHTEQLPVDAIVLEMASLKLSHDASMLEYVEACLLAMLSFAPLPTQPSAPSPPSLPSAELIALRRQTFSPPAGGPSLSTLKALLSILRRWSPVLAKFGKHRAEQVTFIHGLVRACRRWRGAYSGVFALFLRMLVENVPVVEEEAVWEWEQAYRAEHGPNDPLLLQAQPLLTWLKEAEEEEEDDEEDGDDDDADT